MRKMSLKIIRRVYYWILMEIENLFGRGKDLILGVFSSGKTNPLKVKRKIHEDLFEQRFTRKEMILRRSEFCVESLSKIYQKGKNRNISK